jgi:hypothetical protein
MRRNVGPELYIDNKAIPTGAYVIYPFSDVHLDPEIYPNPWWFDPGRKEAKRAQLSHVGWGGGEKPFILLTLMFMLVFHFCQARRLVWVLVLPKSN